MSATGRGAKREPNDFYRTPAWCVRRILEARDFTSFVWWYEPCCGDGAIVSAVNDYYQGERLAWQIADINGGAMEKLMPWVGRWSVDRAQEFKPEGNGKGICITNPPYSEATEIARRLVEVCDRVLLLLPLSFLGSRRRHAWLRANPPDLFVLPNRPSFTGAGTDASEYAWFTWPGNGRLEILNLTDPSEIKACRLGVC